MAKIDDSVKKKVPELRFKGFTDPWVQRNLADLSDGFSYGLNAAAKEYDGVHGYLRITDIDEVSHSFLPEGLTSPDVPENQLTDYRMDEQSIVYARTGASTGKTYIYRDSDGELYYAGFLIRQKVNKETSAQFVYQNTLTKAWERYVQVMSQRSGQPGINAQEVGRFELTIPEKAEQDKIAHLFNSLDNLIAANQRKLDLLKEQKKGYLQKMFPKNGSKFPQLRFAGFADAWEQCKLGELGSTFTGLTGKTKEDFGHGDAKFVTYMNVFQNAVASLEQLDSVEIDPKQNEVKKGDVFFTTSSETPEEVGMSSVWKYNYDNVYLNSFTFGYRPNIEFDLDYLAAMLRSTTVRKKITFLAQGISRYNISKTKMMDIEVPVPSLEEQAKIGAFLSNVEQTITLHQRKLEKLQELKKGYLQKMFC